MVVASMAVTPVEPVATVACFSMDMVLVEPRATTVSSSAAVNLVDQGQGQEEERRCLVVSPSRGEGSTVSSTQSTPPCYPVTQQTGGNTSTAATLADPISTVVTHGNEGGRISVNDMLLAMDPTHSATECDSPAAYCNLSAAVSST